MSEQLISSEGKIQRMPLGIKGLDENIQGGIPRSAVALVTGAAGTMKSSLSFNALYQEALKKEKVLYITLEQSYISLLNQMINMGYDFGNIDITVVGSDQAMINKKVREVNASKKGHIILSDLGSIRAAKKTKDAQENWWDSIAKITKSLKDQCGITAVALDSINALYVLSEFKSPRTKIFKIFKFFKEMDLTSFIISEMPKDGSKYSQFEIEDFLADAVIVIHQAERNRKVTREINIPKMRATKVNLDVFTLEYGKNGFQALYGGKMPLL